MTGLRLTRRGRALAELLAIAALWWALLLVLFAAYLVGTARQCSWLADHDPSTYATDCTPEGTR